MKAARRVLAGAAVAMALVAGAAAPASAAGPFVFQGDSGTFVLDSNGTYGDVVGDWSTLYNPCTEATPSAPGLTMQVGPAVFGTAQTRIEPQSGGGWFYQDGTSEMLVVLSVADPTTVVGADNDGTITVNSPAPHTLTQDVWFLMDVYEIQDAPTCTDFTPVCEDMVLVFDAANTAPLVGDYTGTIYPTPTTTIDDLGGTGAAFTYGPCDPDFAASFQGQPVTIAGLDLTYP